MLFRSDVTYQWYLNGEAIIGAIYSSCMATASFTNDIQSYQCVVTKRCVEGVIGSAASPVFYIQSTSSNRIPGVGELSIP